MNRIESRQKILPLRQAEAYWSALLADGRLPKRSQIDPRGLEDILKFVFILERTKFQLARFRLAGGHLTKLAGMEVRGRPITSFFELAARDEIAAIVEEVLNTPAVGELALISDEPEKDAGFAARMLLLPIEGEANQGRLILGVLTTDGQVRGTNCKFSIDAKTVRKIAGISGFDVSDAQTAKEFSEDPSVFEHRPHRHLRVVASRDD